MATLSASGSAALDEQEGQVYVKEPLPDCPAIKAGVMKKGDVILRVDGKSVADLDIDEVVS